MKLWLPKSLRARLIATSLVTTVLAVLLLGAAVLWSDYQNATRRTHEKLLEDARFLGELGGAAILFEDVEAAQTQLNLVTKNKGIAGAVLYGIDGTVFASRGASNLVFIPPTPGPRTNDFLTATLVIPGSRVGSTTDQGGRFPIYERAWLRGSTWPRYDGTEGELYDLANDPFQRQNLWADPTRRRLRDDLRDDLFAHLPRARRPALKVAAPT